MTNLRLTIMVGIPGSGKSTLAAKFAVHENAIILSSDKLRGIIGVDENDQSVSHAVFTTMRAMAAYFLSEGKSVIIDATNVSKKARHPFVEIGRKYGAQLRLAVVRPSVEICKARNTARARVVPEFVIDRMHEAFEFPTAGECDVVELYE